MRERRERYIRCATFFPLGSLTPRSPFDVRHLRYALSLSFSHSFCSVVMAYLSSSQYPCQLPPSPPPSSSSPRLLPSVLRSRYSTFIRSANLPDKPMPLSPSIFIPIPTIFFSRSLSVSLTSCNPVRPRYFSRSQDYNIISRLCKGVWALPRPDVVAFRHRYMSVYIDNLSIRSSGFSLTLDLLSPLFTYHDRDYKDKALSQIV